MSTLDLDCWQHKLGMIEGCLRAYSAPLEVMAALAWMKQELGDAADAQEDDAPRLELIATAAAKREKKQSAEPIPLTPSTEEVAARTRGYTPEEEQKIIDMLRAGANVASIADHFPKKAYQTIYAKVTQLKSSGRV